MSRFTQAAVATMTVAALLNGCTDGGAASPEVAGSGGAATDAEDEDVAPADRADPATDARDQLELGEPVDGDPREVDPEQLERIEQLADERLRWVVSDLCLPGEEALEPTGAYILTATAFADEDDVAAFSEEWSAEPGPTGVDQLDLAPGGKITLNANGAIVVTYPVAGPDHLGVEDATDSTGRC